jgi:tRNA (guanine-N7-)-methyltransferase
MTILRSFVRRSGRITTAQQRALDTLWLRYGLDKSNLLNLAEIFGRKAEIHLEIGFGMGDALVTMAKTHPEHDYLGIDVHRPGIGSLLLKIEAERLSNVRVLEADAVEVLQNYLPPNSLAVVYLFFPDPWPKKRHQKRRLVQSEFIHLLAQRMKAGGHLYLATDWQDYAEQMLQVLEATSDFINGYTKGHFAPRPTERPLTKFEQRGQRLGHNVWDLIYWRR